MGGKFINTEVVNTLDAVVDSFKERLSNPFYNFNQEKGTVVTYYNVDLNNTPLDKVTGMQYASFGKDTNTKYNKINNFILYGLEKIAVTIDNTEDGTEAEEIEGDCLLLPNTVHPYAGDFFTINTMKEPCLFRVTDAQSDTFDDASNVWQLKYKLEHVGVDEIDEYNVGTTSHFILTNVGTQYTSILEDSVYNTVSLIEELLDGMREYYKTVFYNDRVNSLIFTANGNRFYDSFLTEFVIRNKLLESRGDYIYIQHQVEVPKTFNIDYSRSFFYILETKKLKKFRNCLTVAYGEAIDSKVNIFSTRQEMYLNMIYSPDLQKITKTIAPGLIYEIFDKVLIGNIIENKKFGDDVLSDIIIKYLNNEHINDDDIDKLDMIQYKDNIQLFYYVPAAMFILEKEAKTLMSEQIN
jgi:hypothetical protein